MKTVPFIQTKSRSQKLLVVFLSAQPLPWQVHLHPCLEGWASSFGGGGALSVVAGAGQFPQLLKGSQGGTGEGGQLRDQMCEFVRATAVAGQVQVNWSGCLSL